MRRILIVGGGQSGLQLALGLLHHGYDVTVMTVHTADELYSGRAVSVQILYDHARQPERDYHLNLWDDKAPPLTYTRITANGEGGLPVFDFTGRLTRPAHSVDERVKMAEWMDMVEERGGRLLYHGVTGSDLDGLARMFDLTIVAAGHTGLADMFPVDTTHEVARMPPVVTVIAFIKDRPHYPDQNGIGVDLVPGVGHVISWPAYSVNGRCRLIFVTGPIGGPLANWPERIAPRDHLGRMLDVLREYLPRRYEVYADAELADSTAVAVDYSVPLVRVPVAPTLSGTPVLGMGDTVVVTSPAVQQDANQASVAAHTYLTAILEQGEKPFDEEFMRRTFDRYMDYARHFAGELTARLHVNPPYVHDVCGAAAQHQEIADLFCDGFDNPAELSSWFADEAAARAVIARYAGT